MRSNLRWWSDGFEITCWNGDIVRLAFIVDPHDREIIAWQAVAGVGISGSMVRDMMLEAREKFRTLLSRQSRAPSRTAFQRPSLNLQATMFASRRRSPKGVIRAQTQ
jgi:transposase InsO family protein